MARIKKEQNVYRTQNELKIEYESAAKVLEGDLEIIKYLLGESTELSFLKAYDKCDKNIKSNIEKIDKEGKDSKKEIENKKQFQLYEKVFCDHLVLKSLNCAFSNENTFVEKYNNLNFKCEINKNTDNKIDVKIVISDSKEDKEIASIKANGLDSVELVDGLEPIAINVIEKIEEGKYDNFISSKNFEVESKNFKDDKIENNDDDSFEKGDENETATNIDIKGF